MYKEEKNSPKQKKIVYTVLLAVAALCFGALWLAERLGSPALVQLCAVGVMGFCIYFVLRYALRRYTYALDEEGVLTLLLQDGSRLPVAEEIPLSAVRDFAPAEGTEPPAHDRRMDFRFSFLAEERVYRFLFRDAEGRTALVLFQPSEELVSRILAGLSADEKAEN